MIEFLLNSVEFKAYNADGITSSLVWGAIGASIFTIPELIGCVMQVRRIFRDESAETISVYWLGYIAIFMLACIPYGWEKQSVMILGTGAIHFIFIAPILYGIHRFRGITKHEKCFLAAFFVIPVAMVIAPNEGVFSLDSIYLLCSVWLIFQFATQPYTMWKDQQSGDLEIVMTIAGTASISFWAVYAFAIKALPLMILNPLLLVIEGFVFYFWFTLPKRALKSL